MSVELVNSPLEKFVARANQLYTLPAVAMEVLQLTNCPRVDTAALKLCIERDPALVSKILRTVNSSLFGLVRDVTDLNQAITLLGIKPLKLLVLGFSAPPKLLSGIEQQSLAQYWKRALVKAIAARELSARYENVDADDAFLAGLLQDIGMLVLLKELGEPYAQFLDRAGEEQVDLVMLELETLGFDHRLLSARMLQSWGLSESLWRPIAAATTGDAQQQSGSKLGDAARVLATADGVTRLITGGQSDGLIDAMQREDETNVTWWSEFAARLQTQVEQMASIFDVSVGDSQQFDDIIRTAHTQLSQEAESAAIVLARQSSVNAWGETADLEQAVQAFSNEARRSFESLEATASTATHSARQTSVAAVDDTEVGVLRYVASSVATCRRRRQPLSLALLHVDNFDDLVFQIGAEVVGNLTETLRTRLEEYLDPAQQVLVAAEAQLALILEGTDRVEAVATARRVLAEVSSTAALPGVGDATSLTLSVGIATVTLPAKNFPPADLHDAAERCLFAVQSSGGDGVKSIDIY
jgi:HD-like signal output (HDOD) protein/GGDEF domain-containing protein